MKKGVWMIIGIIIALLIIGGVAYYFIQQPTPSNYPNIPSQNNYEGIVNNSPSPSNSVNNTNPTSPQTYNVDIQNFSFSPSTLTINVGDTVIWTNQDSISHTITSDSGTELNSLQLSNGQTYSHTFNTAGTYNYHCSVHPTMKGTIVVE